MQVVASNLDFITVQFDGTDVTAGIAALKAAISALPTLAEVVQIDCVQLSAQFTNSVLKSAGIPGDSAPYNFFANLKSWIDANPSKLIAFFEYAYNPDGGPFQGTVFYVDTPKNYIGAIYTIWYKKGDDRFNFLKNK